MLSFPVVFYLYIPRLLTLYSIYFDTCMSEYGSEAISTQLSPSSSYQKIGSYFYQLLSLLDLSSQHDVKQKTNKGMEKVQEDMQRVFSECFGHPAHKWQLNVAEALEVYSSLVIQFVFWVKWGMRSLHLTFNPCQSLYFYRDRIAFFYNKCAHILTAIYTKTFRIYLIFRAGS